MRYELLEIAGAHDGIRIAAARDGADTIAAPARTLRASRACADSPCISPTRSRQASTALAGGRNVASASIAERPAMASSTLAAVAGPMPGEHLDDAEAGDAVGRVLGPAQYRQHILDVCGFRELEAAELDERDVAARELDLEHGAWCEVRNSTACSLSAMPHSRFANTASTISPTWPMSSATETSAGRSPAPRDERRFLVNCSRARPMTALEAARIGWVER